jgi:hypothetical protein
MRVLVPWKHKGEETSEITEGQDQRRATKRPRHDNRKVEAATTATTTTTSMTAGDGGGPLHWDDVVVLENEAPQEENDNNCDHELLVYDEADEERLRQSLKRRGLEIVPQEGDGNCLFRAVSLQVYGDANMHPQVREQCLNFMAKDPSHFGGFLNEPFDSYIERKKKLGEHGNHAEIQACSELFNRPVLVFEVGKKNDEPMNIFHADYKTTDPPIRLSYHDGNHYNAVIDPLVPTAGLGLGLPGLEPGLADKMQVSKALAASDADADLKYALKESQDDEVFFDDQLQRALKESTYSMDHVPQNKALALSDVDATNFELEQAVLEHSMQGYARKQSPVGQEEALDARFPPTANVPYASLAARASPTAHHPPEYPPVVQELVMNGFDRQKVIRAYELIGDSFDDLLAFLMQQV